MKHGIYRHWKGGLYRTLFVATDITNSNRLYGAVMVVYVSLTTGKTLAREWSEFHGNTEKGVPRFVLETEH